VTFDLYIRKSPGAFVTYIIKMLKSLTGINLPVTELFESISIKASRNFPRDLYKYFLTIASTREHSLTPLKNLVKKYLLFSKQNKDRITVFDDMSLEFLRGFNSEHMRLSILLF